MSAAGFEPGSFRSQADSLTSRPSWRGCNIEECRFCYSNPESSALIGNQSRKIQELSRQLKLLTGRLETIKKQNHEHELKFQSSEIYRDQQLQIDSQPQHIETIDKRSNFHLDTNNRFNELKNEL
ncbi:hypothetical protein FHG87_021915 [Trinorchestia longiramus]|nr:hypothetical protein FHG87_021915 [Trinorchestia longiramus]